MRLEKAGVAALERLSDLSDETSEIEIIFSFPEASNFSARVWKGEAANNVSVNQGVVDEVDDIWEDVRALAKHQRKKFGHSVRSDSEIEVRRSADLTLQWFMLHEMMHLKLGHVDLMDSLELFEIEDDTPEDEESSPLASGLGDRIKAIPYSDLSRCLEIVSCR